MSAFNFFGGLARIAITISFVATLATVSGCAITPMQVQFDPCVGQVAGGATLGGLVGGVISGRTGAIAGAVSAGLATAIQGCRRHQAPRQVIVVVQPPETNTATQCQAVGWDVVRIDNRTYKCVPRPSTPNTKPCTRTVQGWENDPYAGLSRGLRSASDKQVPC